MTATTQEGLSDTVDTQRVLDTFVVGDERNEIAYLRARWIETIMIQMVSARAAAGLSQKELGVRIGKPQSSIARSEQSSDIKLGTLFDHLSAAGVAPIGELHLECIADVRQEIVNRPPKYSESIKAHLAHSERVRSPLAAAWKERLDRGSELPSVIHPSSQDRDSKQIKVLAA